MKHKYLVFTSIIILLTIILVGCSPSAQRAKSQQPKARTPIESDLALAHSVTQSVERHKAVDQAVTVILDKDISVAIKVSGFDRLRLKQIREEVNDLIRQMVGEDYSIHITTDKRIFRDLKEVAQQLKDSNGIASPQIQNQVDQLNQDMHG